MTERVALCADCQRASDDWLDYRQSPPLKIAAGAAYDNTARGVAENRRARFEVWRNTIRNQQALIRRICERDHQQ